MRMMTWSQMLCHVSMLLMQSDSCACCCVHANLHDIPEDFCHIQHGMFCDMYTVECGA